MQATRHIKPRRRVATRRVRRARFAAIGHYKSRAEFSLRRFRRGSRLAVALTALLLLLWSTSDLPAQSQTPQPVPDPGVAVEEATGTIRELVLGLYSFLPKIGIAIFILLVAGAIARLLKNIFQRVLGYKAPPVSALSNVLIFLLALGTALSVIAGDVRALVGSVGLLGLALSWALQTPIESFTGWMLNSFKGYYRIGDRIEVGEVFGDVYRIDILTTTVWEAGGPNRPVQGAQPTGALITFPNSEVLRSNVINYTRDFPFVWDEITQGVANESDLVYAVSVCREVAMRVIGRTMSLPAQDYARLLQQKRLDFDISVEPTVFVSPADAWTNLTIRYLVPARERRRWSSRLLLELSREISKPEHWPKLIPAYPRTQVELLRRGEHSAFEKRAHS